MRFNYPKGQQSERRALLSMSEASDDEEYTLIKSRSIECNNNIEEVTETLLDCDNAHNDNQTDIDLKSTPLKRKHTNSEPEQLKESPTKKMKRLSIDCMTSQEDPSIMYGKVPWRNI